MTTHYCITDFGAVGDGRTKNTRAFAAAVAACGQAGGGTVVVPGGAFLTGAIHLVSNLTLHLEAGATVLFSDDYDNEEDFPFVESRWAGTELWMYSPLVFGKGLANVAITGKGTFDGNGKRLWDYFYARLDGVAMEDEKPSSDREKQLAKLNKGRYENTDCGGRGLGAMILRPPLMELNNCRNVRLDGFTNANSPFWNTHLVYCENVTVHDVTFRNPPGAPNGDGLDLDSSSGVRVSNCYFDVNDDCLALKSGMNDDGARVGKATENITISNCTMLRGHGGVVMGSDGAGGVRNVTVTNCVFIGTSRGIRLKSNRGRYSVYQDIRFDNIIMQDVMCPIVMNLYYTCGSTAKTHELVSDPKARPIVESTPQIKNIHISNVTARGRMAAAGVLVGLPERPIENVTLDNVIIDGDPRDEPCKPAMAFGLDEMLGEGLVGRHVKNLRIRNCDIAATHGPAISMTHADGLTLDGVQLTTKAEPNVPLIRLDNVRDVIIRMARPHAGERKFIEQENSESVFLANDNLTPVKDG